MTKSGPEIDAADACRTGSAGFVLAERLEHGLHVRRLHLQIGVATRALRPERVAVELLADLCAGLRGDRLSQLRTQGALREDRLDALTADQVGEIAQILGV